MDFGTLEEHFIPVELKKIPAEYKFNRALIVSLIVITGRKLHTETPQQFHFITADNIILECQLFYILANF